MLTKCCQTQLSVNSMTRLAPLETKDTDSKATKITKISGVSSQGSEVKEGVVGRLRVKKISSKSYLEEGLEANSRVRGSHRSTS